jgi:hypothetical protein
MSWSLLRRCDSGPLNACSRNACSICCEDTHERPFDVKGRDEHTFAERVFALVASVR